MYSVGALVLVLSLTRCRGNLEVCSKTAPLPTLCHRPCHDVRLYVNVQVAAERHSGDLRAVPAGGGQLPVPGDASA